jgi:thiosulfate reductase / polysulfide reductase chain A
MEPEIIRTNCGMCHGGCGMLAHVTGGKLVKVEGDPDCPASRGALCPQGLSATQYVYHPDRLRHPLKRVGLRGEGKWERVSWEEALTTVAGKLRDVREKYGPLGLAVCGGTGRPVSSQLRRFSNIWGTPNSLGTAHNCMYPTVATNLITYGNTHSADMENSRCIVNWTFKVPAHQGTGRKALNFIRGLKKGAKIISVDP